MMGYSPRVCQPSGQQVGHLGAHERPGLVALVDDREFVARHLAQGGGGTRAFCSSVLPHAIASLSPAVCARDAPRCIRRAQLPSDSKTAPRTSRRWAAWPDWWLRGTGPQFGPQTPAHSCHWYLFGRQGCPMIPADAVYSHYKSHTGSVEVTRLVCL